MHLLLHFTPNYVINQIQTCLEIFSSTSAVLYGVVLDESGTNMPYIYGSKRFTNENFLLKNRKTLIKNYVSGILTEYVKINFKFHITISERPQVAMIIQNLCKEHDKDPVNHRNYTKMELIKVPLIKINDFCKAKFE